MFLQRSQNQTEGQGETLNRFDWLNLLSDHFDDPIQIWIILLETLASNDCP
jgi:hypothetical protein